MVAEHVNFYEEYISSRIQAGMSERDVIDSLGDPRLIARTIIQTNTTEEKTQRYQTDGYQPNYYQEESARRQFTVPGWVWILGAILILFLVLSMVMSVLSFLAPILIPVAVIFLLIKLFRDWLN